MDYLNLFVNALKDSERGSELEFMFPQQELELIEKRHNTFFEKFQEEKKIGPANRPTEKVNKICEALRLELERA